MMMGRHGGGWQAFGTDWKVTAAEPGRRPLDRHLDNFFECIRSRGRPNAEIEEGHLITSLCHLANISVVYRSFCNFPLAGNFSGYRVLG